MKVFCVGAALAVVCLVSSQVSAQTNTSGKTTTNSLYIDVHHLEPGKVKFEAVAEAHAKDLAVEGKYGVHFLQFWVDEAGGTIYCVSSSPDVQSIRKTHAEAHGLLPDSIYKVTEGLQAPLVDGKDFFLDVHELGAGKVTAKDVADAHRKDLAVEHKYGVNFVNYWVDEKKGVILCLSQAADSSDVLKAHKEAHGLMPVYIVKVKQGQ